MSLRLNRRSACSAWHQPEPRPAGACFYPVLGGTGSLCEALSGLPLSSGLNSPFAVFGEKTGVMFSQDLLDLFNLCVTLGHHRQHRPASLEFLLVLLHVRVVLVSKIQAEVA